MHAKVDNDNVAVRVLEAVEDESGIVNGTETLSPGWFPLGHGV